MKEVYEIVIDHKKVSDTFHCRDVFAPVGAYLSLNMQPMKFGILTKKL
jgi:S-adenosylmethionine hydrolase